MDTDRGLSGPHLARLLGEWRSSGPAYASLARALRLLVLDGRLPLRTRLPGERELAEAVGVSRTTATAAYTALRDEGFLASRRGSGSWTRLPADPETAPPPSGGGRRTQGGAAGSGSAGDRGRERRGPSGTGERRGPSGTGERRGPSGTGDRGRERRGLRGGVAWPASADVIDLSCAASAAPEGALHAALAAATAELPRHLPGPGYDAAGLPVLREAIAEYMSSCGTPTSADHVLVANGALHAFTLLLRVLAGPGERVVVEHPTYAAALDAVRASGGRPVPVPMTDSGWDMEMLAATLRQAAPALAYLIADHQNPTGHSMPLADRERLVALARTTRTPLVIDEAIVGLHLDAPPSTPVAALDADVITIGSMSKTFWAGLRIGWVRANPALIQRLAAARAVLDIGSPVLEQLVAVELLRGAEPILERQRETARAQRSAFAAALRACLPWRFELPPGGLCLWADLGEPRSTALAAMADRYGVRLAAGPRFGVDGAFERYLRLPYSLPAPVLEDAAERLALAWHAVTETRTSVPEQTPALVA